MNNPRRVRVLNREEGGEWVEKEFKDLVLGDIFTLLEATGETVTDPEGINTWVCCYQPQPWVNGEPDSLSVCCTLLKPTYLFCWPVSSFTPSKDCKSYVSS